MIILQGIKGWSFCQIWDHYYYSLTCR